MEDRGHAPGTRPDITVICEACVEPFTMIHANNYNNAHFCSEECSRSVRSLGRRAERHYHFLLPNNVDWYKRSLIEQQQRSRMGGQA